MKFKRWEIVEISHNQYVGRSGGEVTSILFRHRRRGTFRTQNLPGIWDEQKIRVAFEHTGKKKP